MLYVNYIYIFFYVFFFNLNFILFLNFTILVLPNIKINPPQVYMCSPSWTLLPPPSPYHPWVVPVHQPQASSIVLRTWTGNSFHIWYYTYFNAILPNPTSPSPTESKRLIYTSVSLLLSRIQGYCYHLSKFGFLISPCYSLELCIQMGISFLFSFAFSFFFS